MAGSDGVWFEVGAKVKDALEALRGVETELDRLGAAAAGANTKLGGVSLDKLQTGLGKVRSGLSGFDVLFSGMVKGATAAGAAIGAVGGASLSVGGSFESAMARVGAISQASAADVATMAEKARQMGRDLPISATEAAEAFGTLAQRGMSVKDMLAEVDDVVKLSVSQQTDMTTAADLLGSTMQVFGLDVSESARLVDLFNNACNDSALSIGDFGIAMQYAAPDAKAVGYSVEALVASMEALSQAGFMSEKIGTGLRGIFASLAKAANEGGGAFASMGIKITDASGKLLPLADIFDQVAKAGLNAGQMQALFGTEAGSVAMQLAKSASSLKTYEEGLRKAGSAADNMARVQETLASKIDNLKGSLAEVGLIGFDQIGGSAKSLLDSLVELVNVFGDWLKTSGLVGESLDGLMRGFGAAGMSADDFGAALEKIDVKAVGEKFENFGRAVRAFGAALGDVASAVPWEWLVDHMDSLVKIITVGWAAGKIVGIAESITRLAGAFVTMGGAVTRAASALLAHPLAGSLVIIAAAGVEVGKAFSDMKTAIDEANRAAVGADAMERIADLYQRAAAGDASALEALPEKYQRLALAAAGTREEAAGLGVDLGDLRGAADALGVSVVELQAKFVALRAGGMSAKEAVQALAKEYGGHNAAGLTAVEIEDKLSGRYKDNAALLKEYIARKKEAGATGGGESTGVDAAKIQEGIKSLEAEYARLAAQAQDAMTGIGLSAKGAESAIETGLKAKFDDLAGTLKDSPIAVEAFKERFIAAAGQIGGAWAKVAQGLAGSGASAGRSLSGALGESLSGLTEKVAEFRQVQQESMTLLGVSAQEAGKQFDANVTGAIRDAAGAIKNQFGPAVAINFVASLGSAQAGMSRFADTVVRELRGLPSTATEAGQGMAEGLSAGLTSGEGAARGFADRWQQRIFELRDATVKLGTAGATSIDKITGEVTIAGQGTREYEEILARLQGQTDTTGQSLANMARAGSAGASGLQAQIAALGSAFAGVGADIEGISGGVVAAIPRLGDLRTAADGAGVSLRALGEVGKGLAIAPTVDLSPVKGIGPAFEAALNGLTAAAKSGGTRAGAAYASAFTSAVDSAIASVRSKLSTLSASAASVVKSVNAAARGA